MQFWAPSQNRPWKLKTTTEMFFSYKFAGLCLLSVRRSEITFWISFYFCWKTKQLCKYLPSVVAGWVRAHRCSLWNHADLFFLCTIMHRVCLIQELIILWGLTGKYLYCAWHSCHTAPLRRSLSVIQVTVGIWTLHGNPKLSADFVSDEIMNEIFA